MNDKRKNKSGAGRPFKMQIWIEKLKEVLEENDVVYLTNEDLVFLVNDKIKDEKSQITYRTFKNWIAEKHHPDADTGQEFMMLIKKALIKQKQSLLTRMLSSNDKMWVKYAWLLERKFQEFNLKTISEVKNTNEHKTTIQITAGNDEQAKLIDNIINADFEVLDSKQNMPSDDNNKSDEYEF